MLGEIQIVITIVIVVFAFGILSLIIKWYRKAIHGKALVRTGSGGTKVTFDKGFMVIPVLHRLEVMDITLKTVTIERLGVDGLICKDNMRADIKVTFFVRVNKNVDDVVEVALSVGCDRASEQSTLENLFDAKFSEALKTVGKQFDFVQLYQARKEFKDQIVQIIGRDLNGYVLDDCAIDYLEQTALESLKKDNILDAEGIKKIIDLTAEQQILANKIQREKEKILKKQDVEAAETILELDRQLTEKEEKQKREVANIKDREGAEIKTVAEEQRKISEQSRIAADEEIEIAMQNKQRQVIIATRNKERTDAVEIEKITRERDLQINERERIVELARIEKEKAIEEERKNIQEVIRERVVVEKAVVTEEEKIKDTKQFADADRKKRVAITNAEQIAEQALVRKLKDAEAEKEAAEFKAKQQLIEADASFAAAGKKSDAIKTMAEAEAAQAAAQGISEAKVIEAKVIARQKEGETEAHIYQLKAEAEAKGTEMNAVAKSKELNLIATAEAGEIEKKATAEAGEIEKKALAEAKGIEAKLMAKAQGDEKIGLANVTVDKEQGLAEASVIKAKATAEEEKGMAEARVVNQKYVAEADGINAKAEAMKNLDTVGKDHEEFKLRLDKDKQIELAEINIQKDIAAAQANVISEALKSAKIDIVGGETMFFDKIIGSITRGKTVDRLVENSEVITEIKDQLLDTSEGGLKENIGKLIKSFNISSEDIKNLSVSALLLKLTGKAKNDKDKNLLDQLVELVTTKGIENLPASTFLKK